MAGNLNWASFVPAIISLIVSILGLIVVLYRASYDRSQWAQLSSVVRGKLKQDRPKNKLSTNSWIIIGWNRKRPTIDIPDWYDTSFNFPGILVEFANPNGSPKDEVGCEAARRAGGTPIGSKSSKKLRAGLPSEKDSAAFHGLIVQRLLDIDRANCTAYTLSDTILLIAREGRGEMPMKRKQPLSDVGILEIDAGYGFKFNFKRYWDVLRQTRTVWKVKGDSKTLLAISAWGRMSLNIMAGDRLYIRFEPPKLAEWSRDLYGHATFLSLNGSPVRSRRLNDKAGHTPTGVFSLARFLSNRLEPSDNSPISSPPQQVSPPTHLMPGNWADESSDEDDGHDENEGDESCVRDDIEGEVILEESVGNETSELASGGSLRALTKTSLADAENSPRSIDEVLSEKASPIDTSKLAREGAPPDKGKGIEVASSVRMQDQGGSQTDSTRKPDSPERPTTISSASDKREVAMRMGSDPVYPSLPSAIWHDLSFVVSLGRVHMRFLEGVEMNKLMLRLARRCIRSAEGILDTRFTGEKEFGELRPTKELAEAIFDCWKTFHSEPVCRLKSELSRLLRVGSTQSQRHICHDHTTFCACFSKVATENPIEPARPKFQYPDILSDPASLNEISDFFETPARMRNWEPVGWLGEFSAIEWIVRVGHFSHKTLRVLPQLADEIAPWDRNEAYIF